MKLYKGGDSYMPGEHRCSKHSNLSAVLYYNKRWYCKVCRDNILEEVKDGDSISNI